MKIRFFAQARDAAGCEEIDLAIDEPVSEEQLWNALSKELPGIGPLRGSVRIARNSEYATPDERFADGDEVALIPPVSGG